LPHDVPVLLLDVNTVILVPRPWLGERQLVLLVPPEQLPVDELRSVVGIDSEYRDRERRGDILIIDRLEPISAPCSSLSGSQSNRS
jgi:hypothetical protein